MSFIYSFFNKNQRFSIGFRSREYASHFMTWNPWSCNRFWTILAVWILALSCKKMESASITVRRCFSKSLWYTHAVTPPLAEFGSLFKSTKLLRTAYPNTAQNILETFVKIGFRWIAHYFKDSPGRRNINSTLYPFPRSMEHSSLHRTYFQSSSVQCL